MPGKTAKPINATPEAIIDSWNEASFEGGRHESRVEKINALSKMGSCRA